MVLNSTCPDLLAIQGVWLLELAEGEIFGRASTRALKAFVSKRFDDIVPKYSNLRTRLPRQCVFALTTNDTCDYLVDPTGHRRYWPVRGPGRTPGRAADTLKVSSVRNCCGLARSESTGVAQGRRISRGRPRKRQLRAACMQFRWR